MTVTALPGYRALARRALTAAAWHANRGRLLLAVFGVALGVALGQNAVVCLVVVCP